MRRVLSDGVVPVKVWTDEIEETALQQLRNLSQLPFVHKHVAVMPDVHAGYGSTVGSVIPTKAAVGVDVGCGMMAQRQRSAGQPVSRSLCH
jgi:tRNA-splicing ligase RtcB